MNITREPKIVKLTIELSGEEANDLLDFFVHSGELRGVDIFNCAGYASWIRIGLELKRGLEAAIKR